jgi:hypothetical protein
MRVFIFVAIMLYSGTIMATNFAAGQEWSYKTRPQDSGSTLIIAKVDMNERFGKIFHISLINVIVINPHTNDGISRELPHFPISEESIRSSVIEYKGVAKTMPSYQEGYKTWKEAFDNGNAGVFTITVSEIVDAVEQAMNQ